MKQEYCSYAAVIYVTDVERESVMRMFDWEKLKIPGDEQEYMTALVERDGKKLKVISAKQDEMGMTASATLTTKMIHHFHPEYIIMAGIAAGTGSIKKETANQEFGDVLLATSVWNFSNGKYVPPNKAELVFGEIGFNPRPTKVTLEGDYFNAIKTYADSDRNEFCVHLGPLASGTAIVADLTVLKTRILSGFKDTEGVEMEGYGVAYAACHAIEPKPKVIIAKSVCDFADDRKDDNYQKFASYTSSGFVKDLIEKVLPYSEQAVIK
jgi:nucleoside phosphorylase